MLESDPLAQRQLLTQMTPVVPIESISKIHEDPSRQVCNTNLNSTLSGLLIQQMTSLVNNTTEENSQSSKLIVEENFQLKKQLELLRQSLAEHQEKTYTTEITMMEAIEQMKD